MEVALGFLIALAVGLTGVGAGSVTAPILVLFLGLPAPLAVGTALIFGAIIKLVAVPSYLLRRQVDFRVLAWMLAGGVPGTIAGSILLSRMDAGGRHAVLSAVLGVTIVIGAGLNVWRILRHSGTTGSERDRHRWLPWIMLPIGAEVGFSSAGSGALGSLALMRLTSLPPAQVVGTDVFFGLGVSLLGGGFQWTAGNYDPVLVTKLVIGGAAGVLLGANLGAWMPARPLRLALSFWLVVLGAQLCWRSIG
jgi:uncharacterized membrane protein YfcA